MAGVLRRVVAEPKHVEALLSGWHHPHHVVEILIVAFELNAFESGSVLDDRHGNHAALARRHVDVDRFAHKHGFTRAGHLRPTECELLTLRIGGIAHADAHQRVGRTARVGTISDELEPGIGRFARLHGLNREGDIFGPLVSLQRFDPATGLQIAHEHDLARTRKLFAVTLGQRFGRRNQGGAELCAGPSRGNRSEPRLRERRAIGRRRAVPLLKRQQRRRRTVEGVECDLVHRRHFP